MNLSNDLLSKVYIKFATSISIELSGEILMIEIVLKNHFDQYYVMKIEW